MPRVAHGATVTPEQVEEAQEAVANAAAGVAAGFAVAAPAALLQDFDFLFPELPQDPAKLLEEKPLTVRRLKELGRRMHDPEEREPDPGDSKVPALYTYFGQFTDHDITFEQTSLTVDKLLAATLKPLPLATIRGLKNTRNANLELDSVYGGLAVRDERDRNRMKIGTVSKTGSTQIPFRRPPGKGDDNDLPRSGSDHAAEIGDPRNDENLIVSQLHLAFLKAHNRLVNQGRSFEDARRVMRQHYQHLVIHDFLTRVADPAVVKDILTNGNHFYHPEVGRFFLPLEFAVAGFRFGHTMVRDVYNYNLNFPQADLLQLFTFTAFSGELGPGGDRLPENWIIQWDGFTPEDGGRNKARRFDTKLAGGLFQLQTVEGVTDDEGDPESDRPRLAIRNLLRGYALRMPTGQALAKRMDIRVLTPAEIKEAAASDKQADKLGEAGFLERTPLWYYLLAEAKAKHHGNGHRLGPLGSTLVAEVLIGLVRRSDDSILRSPRWKWTLPSTNTDRFVLADLLRFARADDNAIKLYKTKQGDTVKSIAKAQLHDEKRWPEIFVLERDKIRHRDKPLTAGTVLALPNRPSPPKPTLHRTKKDDTLSEMAARLLNDANRFPEIHRLNRDVLPTNPRPAPHRPGPGGRPRQNAGLSRPRPGGCRPGRADWAARWLPWSGRDGGGLLQAVAADGRPLGPVSANETGVRPGRRLRSAGAAIAGWEEVESR
jgi:nucleoid-associated protein YgaU